MKDLKPILSEKELSSLELFQKLDELHLDPSDYIIFGSGPMFIYGIRPLKDLDDLDLVINEKALGKLSSRIDFRLDDEWDNCMWGEYAGGKIELGTNWGYKKRNWDEIISDSVKIGRYPFGRLEYVIDWKEDRAANKEDKKYSEKDLKHIALIEDFLSR